MNGTHCIVKSRSWAWYISGMSSDGLYTFEDKSELAKVFPSRNVFLFMARLHNSSEIISQWIEQADIIFISVQPVQPAQPAQSGK